MGFESVAAAAIPVTVRIARGNRRPEGIGREDGALRRIALSSTPRHECAILSCQLGDDGLFDMRRNLRAGAIDDNNTPTALLKGATVELGTGCPGRQGRGSKGE